MVVIEKIKEDILTMFHKEYGYCGHCGKKDCGGKDSHSKLENKYVKILDLIFPIIENNLKENKDD